MSELGAILQKYNQELVKCTYYNLRVSHLYNLVHFQ